MRTKHGASRLARQLEKDGLQAESIHGDKSQQARMEALEAFKEGKLQVLVATDVAARGLDIDMLPFVVNYELPHVPEDYIHRIGRTGRAGASGEAISFVAHEEEKYLVEIERLLKKKVAIEPTPDLDRVGARASRADRGSRAAPRLDRPAPREERAAPRGERSAPRGERSAPREERSVPREDRPGSREERELAYARNPDQPIVPQPAATPDAGEPSQAFANHARQAHRRSRPVPALLMKRPAREPETT
jgi:superfamily II DNA/RNA helicase